MRYCILCVLLLFVFAGCSSSRHVRLVVLPDVQTYTRLYPEVAYSQTQWIADHADSIDFVFQLGDLTDHNKPGQWDVAVNALTKLDGKVPYAFVMGNHDLGKNANVRDSKLFNEYFPYDKYSKEKYFGGAYEIGKMDNVWYTFKAGGLKWLVLCLEFGPRDSVLKWAADIVSRHPYHKVIITTHAYMYYDDTRMGEGDRWLPQSYGLGKDSINPVNDGEQMWDKLVCQYPNIMFVFSGHVMEDGTGMLVSTGKHGNKVYQMLANYQGGIKNSLKGKSGFLRIVDMDVRHRQVSIKTYSPYRKEFRYGPDSEYIFEDVDF